MMLCVARVRRAGFTLIEIMIVIAIIAILAGIAIPNIVEARSNALLEVCTQNCKCIGNAIEASTMRRSGQEWCNKLRGRIYVGRAAGSHEDYFDDNNGLVMGMLIEEGYLEKPVTCPLFGKVYRISYNMFVDSGWDVRCSNTHMTDWVTPCYQSVRGCSHDTFGDMF